MTPHTHHHHGGHAPNDAELAELLDLDAEVLGAYLNEIVEWVAKQTPAARTVVDLGAGTGTGSLAFARRFDAAEVVAIDKSALMLERVEAAAHGQGFADRVRVVRADVDVAWPDVGAADLVWAALSLHEFADPDRVLRDVYAALKPGGILVVVELDTLPRFLPDDVGQGLESRCHEALARAGWNAHPDWRPHLERAGFEVAEQRGFTIELSPTPDTGPYAHAYLRRIRSALEGQLTPNDLSAFDRLLAYDNPDGLLRRGDPTVRGSRTALAARRPLGSSPSPQPRS